MSWICVKEDFELIFYLEYIYFGSYYLHLKKKEVAKTSHSNRNLFKFFLGHLQAAYILEI